MLAPLDNGTIFKTAFTDKIVFKSFVRDEVILTSVDPRNPDDKVVEIYGHKLVFLNHYYRKENTPPNYRERDLKLI